MYKNVLMKLLSSAYEAAGLNKDHSLGGDRRPPANQLREQYYIDLKYHSGEQLILTPDTPYFADSSLLVFHLRQMCSPDKSPSKSSRPRKPEVGLLKDYGMSRMWDLTRSRHSCAGLDKNMRSVKDLRKANLR